jgi:hypothetical protein
MSPLLRKRNGSVVYAERNPDGSWFEMPAPDDQPVPFSAPIRRNGSFTAQSSAPESVRQYMREIGKRGGKARAARHSRAEIAAWGRVRRKK